MVLKKLTRFGWFYSSKCSNSAVFTFRITIIPKPRRYFVSCNQSTHRVAATSGELVNRKLSAYFGPTKKVNDTCRGKNLLAFYSSASQTQLPTRVLRVLQIKRTTVRCEIYNICTSFSRSLAPIIKPRKMARTSVCLYSSHLLNYAFNRLVCITKNLDNYLKLVIDCVHCTFTRQADREREYQADVWYYE